MSRPARLLVLSLLVIFNGSCASSGDKPAGGSAARAGTSTPLVAASNGQAPADAQWTLRCATLNGFGHVERARQLKDQLIASTKMSEWYVVHGDDSSTLFYGYYRAINQTNPAEHDRAEGDRAKIISMTDNLGDTPFRGALFVQLSAPDPSAPPEWNLVNTPADRYWTLEVGCYKDVPQRKQLAVDAVREARKMGVEAYYYHGPTASSVCVGAWPREAVRQQESASGQSNDEDQTIVVLPPGLAESFAAKNAVPRGDVRVMTPRLDPADPTLAAALKQYPDHATNGADAVTIHTDPATGRQVQVPQPSYLAVIPHMAASLIEQRTPTPPAGVPGLGSGNEPADTGGLRALPQ